MESAFPARVAALREWASENEKQVLLDRFGVEKFARFVERARPDVWTVILEIHEQERPASNAAAAVERASPETERPRVARRAVAATASERRAVARRVDALKRPRADASERGRRPPAAAPTTLPPSGLVEAKKHSAIRLARSRNRMRECARGSASRSKTAASLGFIEASSAVQDGCVADPRAAPLWFEQHR